MLQESDPAVQRKKGEGKEEEGKKKGQKIERGVTQFTVLHIYRLAGRAEDGEIKKLRQLWTEYIKR